MDEVPLEPLEGYTVGITADRRAGEQAELLRRRGARVVIDAIVTMVPVYRWQRPTDLKPAETLVRSAIDGRVHAITFTSAPAVRNLFAIAETHGVRDELCDALNARVVAACVGPACADAARDAGIDDPLAPSVGRLGLMVRALSDRLHADREVLELASATVELQGHAALVGDEHVHLTRREAGVLAALAARPGAVVSPATLLRTVWCGASGDDHVVGVTIGRLRRKLGDAGTSVRTVPRRGYRLETARSMASAAVHENSGAP